MHRFAPAAPAAPLPDVLPFRADADTRPCPAAAAPAARPAGSVRAELHQKRCHTGLQLLDLLHLFIRTVFRLQRLLPKKRRGEAEPPVQPPQSQERAFSATKQPIPASKSSAPSARIAIFAEPGRFFSFFCACFASRTAHSSAIRRQSCCFSDISASSGNLKWNILVYFSSCSVSSSGITARFPIDRAASSCCPASSRSRSSATRTRSEKKRRTFFDHLPVFHREYQRPLPLFQLPQRNDILLLPPDFLCRRKSIRIFFRAGPASSRPAVSPARAAHRVSLF